MRVPVIIVLLALVFSSLGAATIMIEGVEDSSVPAFTVQADGLSLTFGEQGVRWNLHNLSLGDGLGLSKTRGSLASYLNALQGLVVDRLIFGRGTSQLVLFGGHHKVSGAIISLGCLTVGVAKGARPKAAHLFHRWRDERVGWSYHGRYHHQGGPIALAVELVGSAAVPLRLIEELIFEAGPLSFRRQVGPLARQRHQRATIEFVCPSLTVRGSWDQALGAEALYSGTSQTLARSVESAVVVRSKSWKATLSSRASLRIDEDGRAKSERSVEGRLERGHVSVRLVWEGGQVHTRWQSDTAKIDAQRDGIVVAFGFAKAGWHFDLLFGGNAIPTLRWSYTLTIGRGSGSPQPRGSPSSP